MTEEGGDAEQPMASMFIELCQLTDGVPWTLRGQQEPTSGPKRYWHERYRWVEMEEAFDTDVGEFSPPEVPNFTYEEINVFKSRVKKGEADGASTTMCSALVRLRAGVKVVGYSAGLKLAAC
nr:unnamed protein product [Spirometra erinaceieuropaei]